MVAGDVGLEDDFVSLCIHLGFGLAAARLN